MRRSTILGLTAALALASTAFAPTAPIDAPAPGTAATLEYLDPAAGGPLDPLSIKSDNVEYMGTLPESLLGVGARLVTVGDQTRFYVSSIQGPRVYDVTDPASPVLLGALELPHWENENVAVSADGSTILMSEFTGTYMHVIDVSEGPAGTLILEPVGFTPGPAGHIVTCIDPECTVVWGAEGSIIDLRDKTNPVVLDQTWTEIGGLNSGHNLEVDVNGLVWTDTTPIGVFDPFDDNGELTYESMTNPELVVRGESREHQINRTQYQHNQLRANHELYEERPAEEYVRDLPKADVLAERKAAGQELGNEQIRPGELFYGNGETNATGDCEGNGNNGPFATWRIRTMDANHPDAGSAFEVMDVFEPVSGDYTNGDPAVNALGCSGHWFTLNPSDASLVAAGWYEHGTRFLSIDQQTGDISQVGFFQPVVGSASQAYWVDDEYVYVVDYERGVDILRFNDDPEAAPSSAITTRSWLAKVGVVSALAEAERYACSLAASN